MTYEEAIYQITNYGLDDPDSPKKLAEAAEKWREACEKQIPKKPNDKKYRDTKFGKYSRGRCPCCNEMLDDGYEFCGNCGQKIEWEDDDANE